MKEEIKQDLINRNKNDWFITHLLDHFDETGKKPQCPVCLMDIDQVAEERFDKLVKKVAKHLKNLKEGKE